MTKNPSDGDFDVVFKYVALPQFSKGKILTPVCHRQGFIPSLVEKTWPTVKNVQYPIAGDSIPSLRGMAKCSGLNQRGGFIINPDGIIMEVAVLTGPVGRNVEELIRQIKAMQAVAENPGKAAPAGWKPGGKLIGKFISSFLFALCKYGAVDRRFTTFFEEH